MPLLGRLTPGDFPLPVFLAEPSALTPMLGFLLFEGVPALDPALLAALAAAALPRTPAFGLVPAGLLAPFAFGFADYLVFLFLAAAVFFFPLAALLPTLAALLAEPFALPPFFASLAAFVDLLLGLDLAFLAAALDLLF